MRNSSILSAPKILKSFGDDDIDSTGFKVFTKVMLCYVMMLSFSSPFCVNLFLSSSKSKGGTY